MEPHSSASAADTQPSPLTPQEYRAAAPRVDEVSLTSALVQVVLLPNPRRARYVYKVAVEVSGSTEADEWEFTLPWDKDDIRSFAACDPVGTLQTSVRQDGKLATLCVSFREPARPDHPYSFTYEYEQPVMAVVADGTFTQTVTFAGWFMFNLNCRELLLDVQLPPRSTLIEAVPSAKITKPQPPVATYEFHAVRSLETTTCAIGYRKFRLGASFYFWTLSAIGSGVIGWGITRLFG